VNWLRRLVLTRLQRATQAGELGNDPTQPSWVNGLSQVNVIPRLQSSFGVGVPGVPGDSNSRYIATLLA
jgi:hypothetical protein